MLPFYLDQGRGRRAEAAQRRRGGPCGRGGAWAPRGGEGGGVGARRGHLQGGWRWAKMGHRILIVFFSSDVTDSFLKWAQSSHTLATFNPVSRQRGRMKVSGVVVQP